MVTNLTNNETTLVDAAWNNNYDAVKSLLDNGICANMCALDKSAHRGHVSIVKLLLDSNPKLNKNRALVTAILGNQFDVVKLLLDEGADVNARDLLFFCGVGLQTISYAKQMKIIKLLLDRGHHVGKNKMFRWCADYGDNDVMKIMLNYVDIRQDDDYVLKTCIRKNNTKAINMLFNKNAYTMDTILRICVVIGNIKILRMFLDSGCDIRIHNDMILCVSAEYGRLDIVKLAIDGGCDVHVCDDIALRMSAKNNHYAVVEYLLNNGADVSAADGGALGLSSAHGHVNVVRLLLDWGADMYVNNFALKMSMCFCRTEVVKLLLEQGKNIDHNYVAKICEMYDCDIVLPIKEDASNLPVINNTNVQCILL